jgi:hypothetical protein
MDPNTLDPRKVLEAQSAYEMGGVEAVYLLGKTDTLHSATEYLQRVQRLNEARAAAMSVVIEDFTEAIIALHSVKRWASENLPEIDLDLWEILMSVDTSSVELEQE